VNCASCGRANRAGARFCGGCGASLAPRCPACGAENEPDARFCDACGASLVARPADDSVARKVVTIVFADLIGSTALHERLDAESVRQFMESYYAAMRGAVEVHGGRVTQVMGDGVKAMFGAPRVAEDDAIRAVRAGVEMQRAFRALAEQQRGRVGKTGLRVAVNTGEVVADDETEIIGDPVNVAARLQEQGKDGDVVIGGSTQRIVASLVTLDRLGSFALKGRSEEVEAYRVVSLERPAGAPAIAFVGRDDELRRLAAVYDAAVAAPAARLAVLLGSPGLGKSRLLAEFARRLGSRALVLTAQCVASGAATFAPLAEALRAALAVLPDDEAERTRIAEGIGALLAGTPATPEETFFVVRRLLAALATAQPVVLAIDDLQWAEPLLLDLTEHLVQWGAGVPLLVLAAARPELRDIRSSLAASGGVVTDVVTLGGLDAGAATRLAANVIGADALPAAVAGRVLATSEGNPLFLGELVRMLVNDGVLKREGDRWTAGVALADLDIPPTIHALLAARIERLRAEDRLVLERAAVVGRQFSRAAVAHLLPREAQADLDAKLESLRRSELIEPDTGWLLGEPLLRFHHVLIRDAAYRRLLRNTRAELHARFAEWLEARVGDSALHDETIGWHLEQAHQHLRELGPLDANGRALGERAARHLAAAGRRALARDDLQPAGSLLGRALDRLDAADPARADLALDWCEALLAAGAVGPAARALAELGRFVGESERLRAWHTCFTGELAVLNDPQALRATTEAVAGAAEALASAGDGAGEAKAHFVHARALAQLGKIAACEAALDKALAAARRVRDRRRSNAVLAGAPVAALWGPSPVTRASGRCLDVVRVLRITQGAPAVEAVALRCQAVLETLRGRAPAARSMIAASRRMVEELGITQRVLEADLFAGLIELLEGDAAAAERWLRAAWDGLREQGLGIDAAQAGALLGRVLLAQGRAAEAEALSHESEALAGDSFKAAIAWRGVRAEALSARGEHVAAVELASKAVDIAAATDDLLDHADARQALAGALRAAGRGAEADAEEQRAIELWESKGATLLVERARREIGIVRQPERLREERAEPVGPVRRRVRANAASANAARLQAAISARNAEALPGLLAADFESTYHPTELVYDRRAPLAHWQELLRARDPALMIEELASLGDSLALVRQRISFTGLAASDGVDFGAVLEQNLVLIEVDALGQSRRVEIFASDRLGDAVIRLYERYAELLPRGPERVRAAATARAVAASLGTFDPDAIRATFSSGVEVNDHRTAGFGSLRGVEIVVRVLGTAFEVADDLVDRGEDVIAAQPNGFLVRWTMSGRDRVGGGEVEWPHLRLSVFGADGLVTRSEAFAADQQREALARFDELTAEPPAGRFENAAVRAQGVLERSWRERRLSDVIGSLSPDFVLDDRRALVGLRLSGEDFVENLHLLFATRTSEWRNESLATRGEHLALFRVRFAGTSDSGAEFVEEHLSVFEEDPGGRWLAVVVFDLDQRDAAYAELDDRYAAGEGAGDRRAALIRAFGRAFAARDWDGLTALLAPDLVVHDHRLLGWETLHGPAAYVAALRSLVELAPDAQLRIDHVEMSERGFLCVPSWVGTREGGSFEAPSIFVTELDALGRIRRFDQYDPDQLDAAQARLAELPAAPRAPQIENAATRAGERAVAAAETLDWQRLAALYAPGFRSIDRQRTAQLESDRNQHLEAVRQMLQTFSALAVRSDVLATRGDRLALVRAHWLASGGDAAGPSELEWLEVFEVGEDGRFVLQVSFDTDQLDAAYAELDQRYGAGEGAGSPAWAEMRSWVEAFARRDWAALASHFPTDVEVRDHRTLGWGAVGQAAQIDLLRSLAELAPDVRLRLDHFVGCERGALTVARMLGTRDGGAFEMPRATVRELDGSGRLRRIDHYDLERLDLALARFDELRPDPLHIPSNAATRAADRIRALLAEGDWPALRALTTPDFTFDDRRRRALLSGDVELYVRNLEVVRSYPNLKITLEPLGTVGDLISVARVAYAGGPEGSAFEGEFLLLTEIDAAGQVRAIIHLDAEDRGAAFGEANARFVAGEAAGDEGQAAIAALGRAVGRRDWKAVRDCCTDDFETQDHRRLGLSSFGVDEYVESLRALTDLAPDLAPGSGRILAWNRHGRVFLTRTTGTHDGGPFEHVTLVVAATRGARVRRIEVFDPVEGDRALARFAELSAG